MVTIKKAWENLKKLEDNFKDLPKSVKEAVWEIWSEIFGDDNAETQ